MIEGNTVKNGGARRCDEADGASPFPDSFDKKLKSRPERRDLPAFAAMAESLSSDP
ncbi:MAG: hypothetical protein AB7K64_02815 [Variibacter sp.]